MSLALFLAALLGFPSVGRAGTPGYLSDSWYDTIGNSVTNGYVVKTTASFTVDLTLPWANFRRANLNPWTSVLFQIDGATLINAYLGDDPEYVSGRQSASFPYLDAATGKEAGSLKVSWTPVSVSIRGAIQEDLLGGEAFCATNEEVWGGVTNSYGVSIYFDDGSYGAGDLGIFSFYSYATATGTNLTADETGPDGNDYLLQTGLLTIVFPEPPVFSVSIPTNHTTTQGSTLSLNGTFADTNGIAGIWCVANNSGQAENPVQLADFTTNESPPIAGDWNAVMDFSQIPGACGGSNSISFYAVNTAGVASSPITRVLTWQAHGTLTLKVNPEGRGAISGVRNGQIVQCDKPYVVRAFPANKNWTLLNWTDGAGNVLGSGATFTYVSSPTNGADEILIANFTNNPYPQVAGVYEGLVVDDASSPGGAGYIAVAVSPQGAYSGFFTFGSNVRHSVSGRFGLDADPASASLAQADTLFTSSPVEVGALLLNLYGPANGSYPFLSGSLQTVNRRTGAFFTCLVDLKRVAANSPHQGSYNFAVAPVASDPNMGPAGLSFGNLVVDGGGDLAMAITLADGLTPRKTFATRVCEDGSFPFYIPLYGGQGAFFGWMQFTNDITFDGGPVDLEGSYAITWSATNKAPYGNGFYLQAPSAFGSRYPLQPHSTNLFGSTALTLQTDPFFTDQTSIPLTYAPRTGTLTVAGPNLQKVKLQFTAATGAFTGTELVGGKTVSIRGLLVPSLQMAFGFYMGNGENEVGNGESGPVLLLSSDLSTNE